MKAKDYISFYEVLNVQPVLYRHKKKDMSISDFLENYPETELDEIAIERIEMNEKFSLSKLLENYSNTTEAINFLREAFDSYRQSGGNAFRWLYFTFDCISLNPQNFKAEHRGAIEQNLILWIDNFNKQPYDLLELVLKDKGEFQQIESTQKILAPIVALFCQIVKEMKLINKSFDESNESYILKVCENFRIIANANKVRQHFRNFEIKDLSKERHLKKVIEQILPLLPAKEKELITNYINSKTKMYV